MATATIKEKLCTPSWLTGKAKANSYDGKPRTVKWSNARGYNIVGQVFHDPVVKQWQTMAYDADDGTIIIPSGMFFSLTTAKQHVEEEVLEWITGRPEKRAKPYELPPPGWHKRRKPHG